MQKEKELMEEQTARRLMLFGQRLENQRKLMKLTQTELAKQCHTSQRVQSGYELGKVAPKLDYLFKLDALGFDIQSLLFGREQQGIYVLESREQTVMDLYREAPAEAQLQVLALLAGQSLGKDGASTNVNSNTAVFAGKQSIKSSKKKQNR